MGRLNLRASIAPNASRPRLSDGIYEALLEAIATGRLAPGEIISEVALAADLHVSRTPVHDALKQLAKDGLIEQRANRRAVVARFSPADVADIFEMRKLLEGEAARRAAGRMDRAARDAIRDTLDTLAATRDDPGWVARWADADEEFHAQIARAAGSPRLCQDILRYRVFHRSFNRLATTLEDLGRALDEHRRILHALDRDDPDGAALAMVAHIHEWQTYFVTHFPRGADTT